MLDHFLDAYDNQTDKFKIDIEMIRQNFEILLFAGIDTSSNVASMATYNLAKNPEVKAQLISEIKTKITKLETESDLEKILELKLLSNII